jgi:hypothetical protein
MASAQKQHIPVIRDMLDRLRKAGIEVWREYHIIFKD